MPPYLYIPDFVTPGEEDALLRKIAAAPINKWTVLRNRRLQTWGCSPSLMGSQSAHSSHGKNGDSHHSTTTAASATATANTSDSIPLTLYEPLPPHLDSLAKKIASFPPLSSLPYCSTPHNNCLVNEYLPGQGIFPHEDGPVYHPSVCTVSLGGSTILHLYEKTNLLDSSTTESSSSSRKKISIFLEPRSLFVLLQDGYEKCLHGIDEHVTVDLVTRETVDNYDKLGAVPSDSQVTRETTRVSLTFRSAKRVSKPLLLFGKRGLSR